MALVDEVSSLKSQFKAITNITKAIDKILKTRKSLVKLNLNHLITSDPEDEDDGED